MPVSPSPEILSRAFHVLAEYAPDVVSIIDAEGTLVFTSGTVERILGHRVEDLAGSSLLDLAHPEDRDTLQERISQIQREEAAVVGCEARLRHAAGNWRVFEVKLVNLLNDPTVGGILVRALDVTDRMPSASAAPPAPNAGTDQLIAEVAHELKNPLSGIKAFTTLLRDRETAGENRELLDLVLRETDRMMALITSLREPARLGKKRASASFGPVDLNDAVRHILAARRPACTEGEITVREELDPDIPAVWADRSQIEQVLMNLLVNAEQAVHGSTIREIEVRTGPGPSGVRLLVRDTGRGVPEADLPQLFKPFWTTRKERGGMGLGLSVVRSILEEHGADIRVESTVGRGTDFVLDFPSAT